MPATPSLEKFAALKPAYEKALGQYFSMADVSGVDIGFVTLGQEDLTIRVHYRGAKPPVAVASFDFSVGKATTLNALDISPPVQFVKGRYRYHVAPVPPGPGPALTAERKQRCDPVRPGVSVAQFKGTGGTLGLIVRDRLTGEHCVLSNAHVLDGPLSDDGLCLIVQPKAGGPPVKTITSPSVIATLVRKIDNEFGDAAIGQISTKRTIENAQCESNVVVHATAAPTLGDIVEKSGVTTRLTRGVIDGIGMFKLTATAEPMSGFRIVPETGNTDVISLPGDSGAVWYRVSDGQGVGLHVGGPLPGKNQASANAAIACSLSVVLEKLQADLIPPAGA